MKKTVAALTYSFVLSSLSLLQNGPTATAPGAAGRTSQMFSFRQTRHRNVEMAGWRFGIWNKNTNVHKTAYMQLLLKQDNRHQGLQTARSAQWQRPEGQTLVITDSQVNRWVIYAIKHMLANCKHRRRLTSSLFFLFQRDKNHCPQSPDSEEVSSLLHWQTEVLVDWAQKNKLFTCASQQRAHVS